MQSAGKLIAGLSYFLEIELIDEITLSTWK